MANRVQLSDGGLAWFWALGDADIEYRGDTHPVGKRWPEYIDAALAYLAEYQPPVLEHHDRESRPLGIVRRARVLTQDEAKALGIAQTHGRALYLGVELNARGQEADEDGELIYGSLGLDFDWTDERGRSWAMAIKEFSCVTVPHLKAGQIQRPQLRGIQLSDPGGIMDNENMPGEGAPDLGAVMTAIEALSAQVAALVEAMSAKPDAEMAEGETVEEDAEMAEGEAPKEDESAELREQVQRLTMRLSERDADDAVAALRARTSIDAAQAKQARALYLRDRSAFKLFSEAMPARPAATERVAGPALDTSVTLAERASHIQKTKGVAFKDACQIALAEGYTRAEG